MAGPAMPARDLALILLVCLVWAGNFIAAAQGMQHFSPFVFTIVRFGLLLLLLLPFMRRPPPDQWPRLFAVCLSIGALHFSLIFWALARSTDISSVAIVQQTYIPMAVLLAILLMGERVGWKTLAAVLIAFLGVLVVGFDPVVLGQTDVLLITLASAFFQALGSIFQRGMRGIGVLNFQAWTALIALPFLILASLLAEQGQFDAVRTAGWEHWAAILYSVLLASIVGHGLFFFLVQRHPVTAVMPYLQLTPILAVLLGGALVIMSILFITLRARRRSQRWEKTS